MLQTIGFAWLALAAPLKPAPIEAPSKIAWRALQPGLEVAVVEARAPEIGGDPRVHILRVDPARFALKLVTAKALGVEPKSARGWAEAEGLVAAITPSMYQEDHRTSVSLMRGPGFVNQRRLSKDNAVLAFARSEEGVAHAQIIDRTCQPFRRLRRKYQGLVQSIRMIDCQQRNVWSLQERRYRHAVIGADAQGRLLLIYTAALWRTHDFVNLLLGLPLELKRLQYGEGGAPAQLYIKSGGFELEQVGAPAVPNVVGIVAR